MDGSLPWLAILVSGLLIRLPVEAGNRGAEEMGTHRLALAALTALLPVSADAGAQTPPPMPTPAQPTAGKEGISLSPPPLPGPGRKPGPASSPASRPARVPTGDSQGQGRKRPGKPTAQDDRQPGDATSGRTIMGRSDLTGSAFTEAHFYVLESEDLGTAGRVVTGVRYAIQKRLILGADLVIPWADPGEGDSRFVFANPSLSLDVRVFGGEEIYGLVGWKIYLPVLGEFDGMEEYFTDMLSNAANTYELGHYLPYTLTLRPDFRVHVRSSFGLTLAAEWGFDLHFPTGEGELTASDSFAITKEEDVMVAWHLAARVGYLAWGLVFPFLEFSVARIIFSSENADALGSLSFHAMLGPGVQLQVRSFEAGLSVIIPLTNELQEVLTLAPCIKVGGRF